MNRILLCAALALGLGACSSPPPAPAPAVAPDVGLANQVRQSLQASTDVNGWAVGVDSHNGQVTLTGTVTSQKQKQAAERIASAVPGVKIVFNQLVVKE